jgi:hypothetical protein
MGNENGIYTIDGGKFQVDDNATVTAQTPSDNTNIRNLDTTIIDSTFNCYVPFLNTGGTLKNDTGAPGIDSLLNFYRSYDNETLLTNSSSGIIEMTCNSYNYPMVFNVQGGNTDGTDFTQSGSGSKFEIDYQVVSGTTYSTFGIDVTYTHTGAAQQVEFTDGTLQIGGGTGGNTCVTLNWGGADNVAIKIDGDTTYSAWYGGGNCSLLNVTGTCDVDGTTGTFNVQQNTGGGAATTKTYEFITSSGALTETHDWNTYTGWSGRWAVWGANSFGMAHP